MESQQSLPSNRDVGSNNALLGEAQLEDLKDEEENEIENQEEEEEKIEEAQEEVNQNLRSMIMRQLIL